MPDDVALDRASIVARSFRVRDLLALAPALAAIAYPFSLQAFHGVVAGGKAGPAATLASATLLLAAFMTPGVGLALALRGSGGAQPSRFQLRARRLALLSIAAPPLFVFLAFLLGVLRP